MKTELKEEITFIIMGQKTAPFLCIYLQVKLPVLGQRIWEVFPSTTMEVLSFTFVIKFWERKINDPPSHHLLITSLRK